MIVSFFHSSPYRWTLGVFYAGNPRDWGWPPPLGPRVSHTPHSPLHGSHTGYLLPRLSPPPLSCAAAALSDSSQIPNPPTLSGHRGWEQGRRRGLGGGATPGDPSHLPVGGGGGVGVSSSWSWSSSSLAAGG